MRKSVPDKFTQDSSRVRSLPPLRENQSKESTQLNSMKTRDITDVSLRIFHNKRSSNKEGETLLHTTLDEDIASSEYTYLKNIGPKESTD